MRSTRLFAFLLLVAAAIPSGPARAYVINNWWPDATNIVFDNVFIPADVWSAPAEGEMSEWNELDTTDNSHPFRIANNPQFSFGADDGDNTIGFLNEAGVSNQYGLSYADALAWTVCYSPAGGRIDECDVMLNPALPWSLSPDPDNYFQSTVLHELGHVRGLDHYNAYLSMQNSGVDKLLRAATLYMDDKFAVRQHASHVEERDIVVYNKYHTGSVPAWMTANRTTAREGESITFNNITVENRGTLAFGPLRFGIYMSSNDIISTGDQLVGTTNFTGFDIFTFSTFNTTVTVPSVNDCGVRYFGGIIDDVSSFSERYEGNNAVTFSNGSAAPQPFTILLARDGLEPNDTFATSRAITLPFSTSGLSLDSDTDQDYYRFTLSQPARVTGAVNFDHGLGDIDLDLRNASNAIIATSAGTASTETIAVDLQPGTYTFRVFGFGAGSCNRYSMNASAVPLQSLSVGVTSAQGTFAPGQTVSPTVTITSAGGGVPADFYAGLLRPDGSMLFYTGTGFVLGRIDNASSFRAVATGVSLAAPFSVTIPNAFSYQWSASDPRGTYTLLVFVLRAGRAASGTLTSGDVFGFGSATVSFP
jgi:hypothetical protein